MQKLDLSVATYWQSTDKGLVYFIPADWPQEDDPDDGMTVLGWAAASLDGSGIETMWIPLSALVVPLTEAEARERHPGLFAHLAAVDAGTA